LNSGGAAQAAFGFGAGQFGVRVGVGVMVGVGGIGVGLGAGVGSGVRGAQAARIASKMKIDHRRTRNMARLYHGRRAE